MPPPWPALLLGRCTAHCCTAAGVTRRTRPGWPTRGFRPASSSLLGAELRVPTKSPIRALPDSCWGNALLWLQGRRAPWTGSWLAACSIPHPSAVPPPNHHESLGES